MLAQMPHLPHLGCPAALTWACPAARDSATASGDLALSIPYRYGPLALSIKCCWCAAAQVVCARAELANPVRRFDGWSLPRCGRSDGGKIEAAANRQKLMYGRAVLWELCNL